MSKAKPELKLVEDTGSQLQDEDLSAELPPQQSEMPFAVVEGEPMTQLPRDLYIPPDALQVFLTAFEGPLDLLLYLIRKQNLDILNIPIAEITRQYMKYIEVMAELQLELAGEYLLMAAMLAEIKSRMLLPRPAAAEGTDEDDPRAELVRRLQEYERFKKAAEDIDRLNRLERDNIAASAELEERQTVKLLPDVTLKEMLDAFRDVLSRAEKFAHHHISRERLSQRERMTEILARLQTVAFFEFRQLFKPEEGRMGVTVTFIAILELMKEGLIEIVQAEAYAPIHVRTAQRHLKVVQGGPVASETADAENVAALAQPELAGENDIPDEDDTPPADDAAIAVQEAVADVAAASSIAVDSIESDDGIVDAGFVEAAVSEAMASTENAVETVAEIAATDEAVETVAEIAVTDEAVETVAEIAVTDEAVVAAAVAEGVAAGSPVVIDDVAFESPMDEVVAIDAAVIEAAAADMAIEASLLAEPAAVDIVTEALMVNAHVYDEVTLEDVPHDFGAVDPAVANESDPLAAQAVEPVAEQVAELSVSPVMDVLSEDAITHTTVIEGTVSDAPESVESLVSSYTPDLAEPTEAVEPTQTVEPTEAVEPTQTVEPNGAVEPAEAVEPNEAVAAVESVDVVAGDEHTIEEHVVEEHEVEEHIVPEHVVEEHVVPGPVVVEEDTSQADETLAVVEEFVASVETAEVVEEVVAQAEPVEITDEPVASSDFTTAEVVDEHAPAVETTDVVVTEEVAAIEAVAEHAPALEAIQVVAEDATSSEPVEVIAEVAPAVETIEVAVEDVPTDETTNVVIDDAPVEETTNVVIEDAAAPVTADAAEHDEATTQQNADLAEPDLSKAGDSVTGASDEADNSDAEPTR